jgi:hypothetical protein
MSRSHFFTFFVLRESRSDLPCCESTHRDTDGVIKRKRRMLGGKKKGGEKKCPFQNKTKRRCSLCNQHTVTQIDVDNENTDTDTDTDTDFPTDVHTHTHAYCSYTSCLFGTLSLSQHAQATHPRIRLHTSLQANMRTHTHHAATSMRNPYIYNNKKKHAYTYTHTHTHDAATSMRNPMRSGSSSAPT